METRKLIKFGGSSHIIAIPNGWIRKNSLSKGDLIYIKENGDNELILLPTIIKENDVEKTIRIDADKRLEDVKREIIAAYINNYNVIEVSGENLKRYNPDIKKIINDLVAIEIIEESSDKIIARDFLNIKEVYIENLIRRMDTIIRLMMENAKRRDDGSAYDEIKNLDKGINKLRFMLYKVIKSAMDNQNLSRKLGMTNHKLLKTWLMVSYLEETADELRRFVKFREASNLQQKDRAKLDECFNEIIDSFINVMEAYYKDNINIAHEIASLKDEQLRKYTDLSHQSKNKDMIPMLEKIKSMGSWIRCIARGIING